MLRRATPATPFPALSAVVASSGRRSIVQLSSTNLALANNAKHLGYTSEVWVEDTDKYWYEKVGAKVKPGETATTIPRPVRLELYNWDQLTKKPADLVERAADFSIGHFSATSNKRYSLGFARALDEFCAEQNLQAKMWLSTAELRKRGLQVIQGAVPFAKVIKSDGKFFNASQFETPALIQERGYSGATGRAYEQSTSALLVDHAKANGFKTAVYFTAKQLETMQLSPQIGAQPVEVAMGQRSSDMDLYPITALKDSDQILKTLGRAPAEQDMYVVSGKPVGTSVMDHVKEMKMENPSKYWISAAEIRHRDFKLTTEGKKMALSLLPASDKTYSCFNIEQVSGSLDEVAAKIGTYVRKV